MGLRSPGARFLCGPSAFLRVPFSPGSEARVSWQMQMSLLLLREPPEESCISLGHCVQGSAYSGDSNSHRN